MARSPRADGRRHDHPVFPVARSGPGEVLQVIRGTVAGSLKAGLVGGGSLPYDGVARVRIADWLLDMYVDAGELDYVSCATGPDGTVHGYREVGHLLEGLAPDETRSLDEWFKSVEPWH